jgi:phospholipase C
MADHYHAAMLGPTYPNRDYLYAATSRGVTSNGSNNYGGALNPSNPRSSRRGRRGTRTR